MFSGQNWNINYTSIKWSNDFSCNTYPENVIDEAFIKYVEQKPSRNVSDTLCKKDITKITFIRQGHNEKLVNNVTT